MDYMILPPLERVERTAAALRDRGLVVHVTDNATAAKAKLFEILPDGASVFTMTSMTLEHIGATKEINESGRYDSIRKKIMNMDRQRDGDAMRRMGAAPDWAVGSVHAVTEDGSAMIASATGSQLPAYAYGAGKVIWVVGTHKIVQDRDEGFRRIEDYVLPLESDRARKAYGAPGSSINKMLIINKEVVPGRITLIFVNEIVGF